MAFMESRKEKKKSDTKIANRAKLSLIGILVISKKRRAPHMMVLIEIRMKYISGTTEISEYATKM